MVKGMLDMSCIPVENQLRNELLQVRLKPKLIPDLYPGLFELMCAKFDLVEDSPLISGRSQHSEAPVSG